MLLWFICCKLLHVIKYDFPFPIHFTLIFSAYLLQYKLVQYTVYIFLTSLCSNLKMLFIAVSFAFALFIWFWCILFYVWTKCGHINFCYDLQIEFYINIYVLENIFTKKHCLSSYHRNALTEKLSLTLYL